MLKFIIRPFLLIVFSLLPLSLLYSMESGINSIPQDKQKSLASYLAGKRTFIIQEAEDKVDFMFATNHVHTMSWNPQIFFQENPLIQIKQQVEESIKNECQSKGINFDHAKPLLTCFLNQYTQAFTNFDETYNKVRALMIQHEAQLKGKIKDDHVNKAYEEELLKITGSLHQTLKDQLQAIKDIKRHTGDELLNICK